MHIPNGTTDSVELELFEPALEAALLPSPDYDTGGAKVRTCRS